MWPPHGRRSWASMMRHHRLARRARRCTISTSSLTAQEVGQRRRIGDRGRQADEAHLRRQRRHARQAERQVMAALAGGEGMQLVDDHAFQAGEELRRIGIGEQQRQRFRRGHQQVRRPLALAQPAALRRVAGAALGPHRQLHLGDRHLEIAADVGGQRLQRRDVERVQLALALLVGEVLAVAAALRELDQGRQEARQGLAAAGRRDQQRALALLRQLDQGELVRPRRPAAAFEPA